MGPRLRLRLREPRSPRRSRVVGLAPARALALTLACVIAAAPLAACKVGPDLALDYGQTALENYELAIGEFEDRDWEEAISYADFVRIRFPFSRYAVEAELLVARAEFEQGNYAIAQDAFKQFGRLHPTHRHVRNGWIAYMSAVSAFMNAPDGVGIMPPYYQRDQTGLRDALGELGYFFDHYSGSDMEPLALELRDEVNRRLLRHEIYVARFYLERNKPEAAIGRLEAAHKDFAGIGLDAEVLFLLGLTYMRMEEIELSRATFAELQAQHPQHHHGKQARLYLKYIYDTYGPADPSRARPDRSPPTPAAPPRPKNPRKPTKPGEGPEPGEPGYEPPKEKTKVIPAGTTPPGGTAPASASGSASTGASSAKPASSTQGQGKTQTQTQTQTKSAAEPAQGGATTGASSEPAAEATPEGSGATAGETPSEQG